MLFRSGPYILASNVCIVFPGNSVASHCKERYLESAALFPADAFPVIASETVDATVFGKFINASKAPKDIPLIFRGLIRNYEVF